MTDYRGDNGHPGEPDPQLQRALMEVRRCRCGHTHYAFGCWDGVRLSPCNGGEFRATAEPCNCLHFIPAGPLTFPALPERRPTGMRA